MDYLSYVPETGHKVGTALFGVVVIRHSSSKHMQWARSSSFCHDGSRLGRLVQSAKWIAEKRKKPRPGHLLTLSLCCRVTEGVREVTIS